MKMQFRLKPYSVTFAEPFHTSEGALSHRRGLYVIVELEDGTIGAGEIAPLAGYSDENLETVVLSAQTLAESLSGVDIPTDVQQYTSFVEERSSEMIPPSVSFGLETAVGDAIAKREGVTYASLLSGSHMYRVPVNAVISCPVDSIRAQLAAGLPNGISTVKVKVGRYSPREDIERVRVARELLGVDVHIRLDANRAWDFETAYHMLSELSDIGLEYVEEPLLESEQRRIGELHDKCGVMFALDESMRDDRLFREFIALDSIAAVILKPAILGGFARMRMIVKKTRAHGKKAVVTSTCETGIGVAACLHLAASFGNDLLPCGLGTLHYLSSSNINERLEISGGDMLLPNSAGLGVTLLREFIS